MLCAVPCVIAAGVTIVVYPKLDVSAANSVNRLVACATALVALPAPLTALICGFKFLRYAALWMWPGRVCVFADARVLVFALGPFGTRRFDAARLETQYPFEQLEADGEAEGFEAFLPQDEQIARLVPWLSHPEATPSTLSIHRTLLRFCAGDEAEIAARLRPAIDAWRSAGATSDRSENDDVH